jgi:alpha-tubulin suppressor-like RCC1 family protein
LRTTLTFSAISTGNPVACSPNREDESCATNSAYHTCAITSAGEAYCWGSNQFGQLGDGSITESAEPKRVTGALRFASISAGDAFTCGITTTHVLYCWGRNSHGQLGIGSADPGPHPEPRAVAQGVRAVAAGGEYACALRDDGTAYCWGNGSGDRIGSDAAIGYGANPSPVEVQTDQRFTNISAGRAHTCAITVAGVVYCWGSNSYLESGPGLNANHGARVPAPIPGVTFTAVSAGTANHTCGVTSPGAMYCWGNNNKNQLGAGAAAPETCGFEQWGCSSTPVAVMSAAGVAFKTVSAGVEFTCGVTTTGEAYCWGDNSRGQLGTGDRQPSSRPKRVTAP